MISDYLANKLLDHALKNTAYTQPSTVYLALFTTAINKKDAIGTPTEVSGTGYARKAITFASASQGASLNSAAVTFDAPTADWGTVISMAIVDASSSGNILFFTDVCPMVISNGDAPPSFAVKAIKAMFGSGGCC